jgi:hypothetical protein
MRAARCSLHRATRWRARIVDFVRLLALEVSDVLLFFANLGSP